MTSEDILTELLIDAHMEGIFNELMDEVNKIEETHITHNNRLEVFEKAIENVRRNKTV